MMDYRAQESDRLNGVKMINPWSVVHMIVHGPS
eukprot:COSAG04_NODE_93_length_26686_cov_10.174364_13_plen_33_part_00